MKGKSPEMESDRGQRGKRGVGECVLCFVLRTTSVSPLDRDKDKVLDPEKYWIIFPFGSGACFFHASFLFFYCRSLQVVYEYRIRIAPGSDVLEIENSMINTAPYERLLGVWSITRLDSFSLKRILLSAGNDSPAFRPEVAKHGDAVTLIRRSRNTELQTAIREKHLAISSNCVHGQRQRNSSQNPETGLVCRSSIKLSDGTGSRRPLFICSSVIAFQKWNRMVRLVFSNRVNEFL